MEFFAAEGIVIGKGFYIAKGAMFLIVINITKREKFFSVANIGRQREIAMSRQPRQDYSQPVGNDRQPKTRLSRLFVSGIGTVAFLLLGVGNAFSASQRPEVIAVISSDEGLLSPRAVCVNEKDKEIFIADSTANKVVVCDWKGMRRADFTVPSPSDLAFTADSTLLVISVNTPEIKRFDRFGTAQGILKITGLPYSDPPRFSRIAIDKRGRLYLADSSKNIIIVANAKGTYRTHFGTIDAKKRGIHFESISGLTIMKNRLYVVDGKAAKVFRFNLRGKLRMKFGERGGTPGMLSMPSSVVVDSEGDYLVLDRRRHVISRFNEDGASRGEYGGKGQSKGWFYFPEYMAMDSTGRIYVCEPKRHRVQILRCPRKEQKEKPTKKKAEEVGSLPKNAFPLAIEHKRTIVGYDSSMKFKNPLSICVDPRNNVFIVADSGNRLVSIFTLEGVLRQKLGRAVGIDSPLGVAVDAKGMIYVSQMNSQSILVIGTNGRVRETIDVKKKPDC